MSRNHVVEVDKIKTIVVRAAPASPPAPFPNSAALEIIFDQANPSNHREYTYLNACSILTVDVWESSLKLNHLFNKTFTYGLDGKINGVKITKVGSNSNLVKAINRDLSGRIISIDRVYTP